MPVAEFAVFMVPPAGDYPLRVGFWWYRVSLRIDGIDPLFPFRAHFLTKLNPSLDGSSVTTHRRAICWCPFSDHSAWLEGNFFPFPLWLSDHPHMVCLPVPVEVRKCLVFGFWFLFL